MSVTPRAGLSLLVSLLVSAMTASASAGTSTCVGDFDNNGIVDGADLGPLLSAWGTPRLTYRATATSMALT